MSLYSVFESEKPDLSLCDLEIPALFAGSYQAVDIDTMQFTRSGADIGSQALTGYDTQCEGALN